MPTFSETRGPTSRKHLDEQGIVMPTWSRIFQTFWSQSSVFALEKPHEKVNFQNFLPSKKRFGGYFQ